MFASGYRPRDKCEWLDAYNKAVYRGGYLRYHPFGH